MTDPTEQPGDFEIGLSGGTPGPAGSGEATAAGADPDAPSTEPHLRDTDDDTDDSA